MLFFQLGLKVLTNRLKPYQLRGYIGNKFKEEILLHHHIDKNKFLYKYPLVQYKSIGDNYYIIGLNEGAYVLKNLWDKIDIVRVYNREIEIIEKSLNYKDIEIGESNEIYEYKFLTRWLPLNQENYEKFKLLLYNERREKLEKILINNIISFCKAADYTIKDRLNCSVNLRSTYAHLKGIKMVAFKGHFKINFLLPDYIGLGKSISRGFGTIMKIK